MSNHLSVSAACAAMPAHPEGTVTAFGDKTCAAPTTSRLFHCSWSKSDKMSGRAHEQGFFLLQIYINMSRLGSPYVVSIKEKTWPGFEPEARTNVPCCLDLSHVQPVDERETSVSS